ncbi:aldo/keto reductase [Aliikangiella marina]|uniref:Aldo/keto reductase n=1 Tax=Aliikangiella marina TaxID=1712262 RepID=A0A545TJ25_9GAMM|nr:aldo/keto reductase [Aliikangiella marina]TQV77215.1 aldo/keto reductase [Aliikangiella marina]
MLSRREIIKLSMLAGTSFSLTASLLHAASTQTLITRKVPKTGESLPVIGLGTSATFRRIAGGEDVSQLKNVIKTLLDNGGTVFDTAPSYSESERVAGKIVQTMGAADRVFWATKLNVVPRGELKANPDKARQQLDNSFQYIGKKTIDLVQVHNLRDIPTQMSLLKAYKDAGRIRYIGTTSTNHSRFSDLATVMRNEPIDFIGVNYAVDDRKAAEEIFPIALDRGIGVLVYLPFGRSRLWKRIGQQKVPEWAVEIGIQSWGQFFLKFVVAHPAVTVVTPATSKPKHMLDNIGAAYGELPDIAMQKRMIEFIDALPST